MRSTFRLAPLLALAVAGCGCPEGLTDCAGVCRDAQSDVKNCGACGVACKSGEVCALGKCALSCQTGLTDCAGTCRDLQTDVANCGACGTKCEAGKVCSTGMCAVSCQMGLTNCAGACRDLMSDVLNCGACGTGCKTGEVCAAGACSVTCQMGLTNCSGTCRDLMSDVANCGACGTACKTGEVCSTGKCALSCQTGLDNCAGICANLKTDRLNCGACGTACKEGEICSAGKCALSCQAGLTNCSGTCSNLQTDLANCGACGTACPTVENATLTCGKGACGFTCNAPFLDCNKMASDGCEANTQTGLSSCGGCGNVCPTIKNGTAGCAGGKCGIASCATNFADCNSGAGDGCESNLKTDSANCGKCGTACDKGAFCVDGACTFYPSCAEIKAKAGVTADGPQWIDADGAGTTPPFQVWCDMTTDGGGWTLCAALTKGYVPSDMLYNQPRYAFQARKNSDQNFVYEREAPCRTATTWNASETLNYGQFCRLMGTSQNETKVVAKLYNYGNNYGASAKDQPYHQVRSGTFSGNLYLQWFTNNSTGSFSRTSGDYLCVCTSSNGYGGSYTAKSVNWTTSSCGSGQQCSGNAPYTHSSNPWAGVNSSTSCVGCTNSGGGYNNLPYGQTTILNNLSHTFWAGIPNVQWGWSDCTANGNCDYHESGFGVWLFYVR